MSKAAARRELYQRRPSDALPLYTAAPIQPPTYSAPHNLHPRPSQSSLASRSSVSTIEGDGGSVDSASTTGSTGGSEPRYVYYRVYTSEGAVPSKTCPPQSSDPYLGRIFAHLVPPPHTVQSIKRTIARAEGISLSSPQLECDLYQDLSSAQPLTDSQHVSIFTLAPEQPLGLVYNTPSSPPTSPSPSPSSIGYEPGSSAASSSYFPNYQSSSSGPIPSPKLPKYSKKVRAKQDSYLSSVHPRFLDLTADEVLYTDGKSRWEVFEGGSGGRSAAPRYRVYRAMNMQGQEGLVMKNAVEPFS